MMYHDAPVLNWLSQQSEQLLRDRGEASEIRAIYPFRQETEFALSGVPVTLRGLGLTLWCSRKWVAQDVRVDLSRGRYDHRQRRVLLPHNQRLILGEIDDGEWQETDQTWNTDGLEPGSVELQLTLVHPIRPIRGYGTPALDEVVAGSKIDAK
jgi:hypothetical protein